MIVDIESDGYVIFETLSGQFTCIHLPSTELSVEENVVNTSISIINYAPYKPNEVIINHPTETVRHYSRLFKELHIKGEVDYTRGVIDNIPTTTKLDLVKSVEHVVFDHISMCRYRQYENVLIGNKVISAKIIGVKLDENNELTFLMDHNGQHFIATRSLPIHKFLTIVMLLRDDPQVAITLLGFRHVAGYNLIEIHFDNGTGKISVVPNIKQSNNN